MHRFFIVGVTLLYGEHALQLVGFVYRVADPRDVANVIFVAFGNIQVDSQSFFVDRVDRIADDGGVAITFRVVEVDQQLFILGILFLVEFRASEEIDRFLVSFLEGATQTAIVELFVAGKIDFNPSTISSVYAV